MVFEAWRVSGGVCISVLLMMREWDVAGRCCAGRGWWCAMACFFFFLGGVLGFTHPQQNFANSIRLRKKNDTISCYLGSMLVYFFLATSQRM